LSKKTILCILLLTVCCCSCTGNPDKPLSDPQMTTISTQEIFQLEDILAQGPYWAIFSTESRFGFAVYDANGLEFFRDMNPLGMVDLRQLSEHLVEMSFSSGESFGTQYFDIQDRRYSPVYWNVSALEYDKVVYCSTDQNWLIVHDIFNPAYNFTCFERSFVKGFISSIPEELTDRMTIRPFATIEFLNENRLHVIYLSDDREFIEETLGLL
ncbi:MAG: hypothetical protein FWH42_06300, partial [Dehalococcoidia bacterium]|nr:hypothetical protein [Dehalococcoidia bacterium]